MPTYDLSLELTVAGTLGGERVSTFTRVVALTVVGALSGSRVSTFTREFTLGGGASLNAFRTSVLNKALTLTAATTLAQAVALTQIADSSVVEVTWTTNTSVVTVSAITVTPLPATVTFDAGSLSFQVDPVVRFRIMRVRPRVSLQIRVIADGQAP